MTANGVQEQKPFWLLIEESFLALSSQDLSGDNLERTIQRLAVELDDTGYNVSKNGGRLVQLRLAMKDRCNVGRPLKKDLDDAVAALTLDDVANTRGATSKVVRSLGEAWPDLLDYDHRMDVMKIVEAKKLELLIAKAKGMDGDAGIRLLVEEKVAPEVITSSLGITDEKLAQVNAEIAKERAEIKRVQTLVKEVEAESDEDKVKHLFKNNVADKLIIEVGGIGQGVIDGVRKAMEEELKAKQKAEEEAAARKKAEAEGPALEAIEPDQMLEYIEALREILDFSDKEQEIRVMSEQSAIPKCLVDIAVSDPDKLDELEAKAEG